MTIFLRQTKPQGCDYCGKVDELRPYGKNGAWICFKCGMKPENRKQTDAAFEARLNANNDPLPPELHGPEIKRETK